MLKVFVLTTALGVETKHAACKTATIGHCRTSWVLVLLYVPSTGPAEEIVCCFSGWPFKVERGERTFGSGQGEKRKISSSANPRAISNEE